MAEAELIITPDVSRSDLNRSVGQLNKAMESAAKAAGKDFEREISKGIRAGGKDGMGGIGGGRGGAAPSANVIDGMKKAGGILGGAAVLALGVGLNELMAQTDVGMSLIERKVSESQAPETVAAARDLGLSGSEYQAIKAEFARVGVTEDRDILETLREITVQTEEGERGENPLLSEFAGMRGADLYRAVFASLGNMGDPAQRTAALATLNEELVPALTRLIDMQFQQAGDGKAAGFTAANFFKVGEAQIEQAKAFEREAQKVEEFRVRQYEQTQKQNAKFWDTLTPEMMGSFFSRQQNESDLQMKALNDLSRNVQAANAVDNAINTAMGSLVNNTAEMIDGIKKLVALAEGSETMQGVNRAAGTAMESAGHGGGQTTEAGRQQAKYIGF